MGVNDYWDSRLRLNFAVPDARALGAALAQAGKGIYAKITVTNLLDGDVTVAGLANTFSALSEKIAPRDVFIFYIAGHGKTVDGKYYFIPQNFRYRGPDSITQYGIDQSQWQEWFSLIPARKSILLYDTCESGSLTGTRLVSRGMERVAALEKLTRAMGRTVLSAATDDGPALEGYRGHGVFTYALLDALAHADTSGNNLIEVTELAAHVDALVPKISFKAFGQRQVPQMNVTGSNFPLVRQTAIVAPLMGSAAEMVPRKPTHVVLRTADIYAVAGGASAVGTKLKPGTLVAVMRKNGGWTLVARDGRKLGFVASAALAPMQ